MKLPAHVLIGSQRFKIEQRSAKDDAFLSGNYGYTYDESNLIVIEVKQAESRKRTTLLHEILHAIRYVFGSGTQPRRKAEFEEVEHYFIGLYEEPLLMVLRENPDVMAYLLEKDSNEKNQ